MLILYIFGTIYVLCLAILVATLVLAKRQDSGRRPLAEEGTPRRRREPEIFRTVH
jgi:hypothetical protein